MSKVIFKTIDEYIQSFPPEIQKLLKEVRKLVRDEVPAAEETIKYDMPTFTFNGKNLVYFSAWKNHLGFYPVPMGNAQWDEWMKEYKTGKGSIQFPYDKPMPAELIKKIVRYRMREVGGK